MGLAKWGVAGVGLSTQAPSTLFSPAAAGHRTPHLRDLGWEAQGSPSCALANSL